MDANDYDCLKTVETKVGKQMDINIDVQKLTTNITNQDEEEAVSAVSKPYLPPVPVNSFQFLNDWNEITPYPDLRYEYLKVSIFFLCKFCVCNGKFLLCISTVSSVK